MLCYRSRVCFKQTYLRANDIFGHLLCLCPRFSRLRLLKRRAGHNVKAAGALVVMVAEVVLTALDVPF